MFIRWNARPVLSSSKTEVRLLYENFSHIKIQVNSMSMSTLAGDTLPESTLVGDAIQDANDIIFRRLA